MKYLLLITLLVASPSWADPVVYERTILKILPQAASQASREGNNTLPAIQRAPKEFTVEVRPLSFLYQRDFISSQPFTQKNGMLVLTEMPDAAELRAANLTAPVDVLFLSETGVILSIAPQLNLSALQDPLASPKPAHAFLFLKGGVAEVSDIQPGDRIENPMFKAPPKLLEAPK